MFESPLIRRSLIVWKEVPTDVRGGLLTLSLEAGWLHELPLFDEEVSTGFAGLADLRKLLPHELPFVVTDAFAEGAFDVDCEPLWAFYSCFHCDCCCWVLAQ